MFTKRNVDLPPDSTGRSLVGLNCTGQVGNTLTVPASTTGGTNITCTAFVKDDDIALEDDETGTINVMLTNPTNVNTMPRQTTFAAIVEDDDGKFSLPSLC